MIKVYETTLPGVKKIERLSSPDHRGFYAEIYSKETYFQNGITIEFVEDDFSFSRKNVLRGLHGDSKTWKLVSCPFGKLYLVVVNNDPTSECFRKWEAFILTPENRLQILIPPLYGNGHLVLSDWAMFHYKQSEYYHGAQDQFVIKWDDPTFAITWPVADPILSQRDGGQR